MKHKNSATDILYAPITACAGCHKSLDDNRWVRDDGMEFCHACVAMMAAKVTVLEEYCIE